MQVWMRLFAKSPFKPLIKHSEIVVETVKTLDEAMKACYEGRYEDMRRLAIEVDKKEDMADRIKEELRDSLGPRLMMAVPREDILIYLHMQDKVADSAEDTAKWLLVKTPERVPEDVKNTLLKMSEKSVEAAEEVHRAIVQLDRVIESGFADREIEKAHEIIGRIEEIEKEIDDLDTKLMEAVFRHEKELSWADGLYILNVARTLSNVSDKAKDAAERMRVMMSK